MTALAAAIGVGIALLLCVVRLFAGPTLYDRTLAMNGIVIKVAIIAAAAAVATGRASLADAALAFLLASVVANVAVLKFFRSRTFQAPLMRAEEL
ncbi:MAG: monovalent cation/H+ antiporter complex subunit F [Terricaulis sp.]